LNQIALTLTREQAKTVRAMESGQLSAGVPAIREKGIGKRVERAELGAPGEFEALSDDDLEQALAER
jgi:hypothetical protein